MIATTTPANRVQGTAPQLAPRRALMVALGLAAALLSGCAPPHPALEQPSNPGTETASPEATVTASSTAPADSTASSTVTTPTSSASLATTAPSASSTADSPDMAELAPRLRPSHIASSHRVLVNKLNPLEPADFAPGDLQPVATNPQELLREEAAEAFAVLIETAQQEGLNLVATSGYRSYADQQQVYANFSAERGVEEADRLVARPGHSEHQTGWAIDVFTPDAQDCVIGECFADTAEGQWVAQNAHHFGFIIRYAAGAEHITGYDYEPWHLRYLGEELAGEVQRSELSLEEFWGQKPAADYPA